MKSSFKLAAAMMLLFCVFSCNNGNPCEPEKLRDGCYSEAKLLEEERLIAALDKGLTVVYCEDGVRKEKTVSREDVGIPTAFGYAHYHGKFRGQTYEKSEEYLVLNFHLLGAGSLGGRFRVRMAMYREKGLSFQADRVPVANEKITHGIMSLQCRK